MKTLLIFLTTLMFSNSLMAQEPIDENTMMAYVVVVDTSLDYHFLHKKMTKWSESLSIEIDTMGRYFDEEKQIICLPEDDEDEIYAGGYYPRRYLGDFLSLEYLVMYDEVTTENTIALVAGIFEKQKDAEKLHKKVIKEEPSAHVIYAELYIGCIH